jgi:transposase
MKKHKDKFVLSILKKVEKGAMSVPDAATRLGCTRQYVNKLRRRYKVENESFLIHGNKGKTRRWKTSQELEARIITLYSEKYLEFNFSHFLEKLNEQEHISISYKPLYRILKNAGIDSPKHHRKRKINNLHPSRPRREGFGELLQIDASFHNWFGNGFPKATLHGAIDDATNTVMGLYFDKEETLNGYYHMLRMILTKYGIPEAFYSDNRTIFEFRKLSEKDKSIDRDVHIQFRRCCEQLGVELITTSVSQAKGRIERLWGTLQSRLIAELMLHNITSIETANEYLHTFTKDHNKRFALEIDYETSLFVPAPSPKEIDYYLSIEYHRMIDNGSAFSFAGSRYQVVDENDKIVKLLPKTKIKVFKTFKNTLVVIHEDRFYEVVPERSKYIPETKAKKPGRPLWKPGPEHPWRRSLK